MQRACQELVPSSKTSCIQRSIVVLDTPTITSYTLRSFPLHIRIHDLDRSTTAKMMSLSRQFAPRALRGMPGQSRAIATSATRELTKRSNDDNSALDITSDPSRHDIILEQERRRRVSPCQHSTKRWLQITRNRRPATRSAAPESRAKERRNAIRSYHCRSDCQLGQTGLAMAHDVRSRLLRHRNDALVHPEIRPGQTRYNLQSFATTE